MLYQHAELLPILVFRLVQISIQSLILSTFISECPNGNTDFCRAGFQYSLFQKSPLGCLLLDLSQSHCRRFWKGKTCSSIKYFSSTFCEGIHGPSYNASWQKECHSEVSRYWKNFSLTASGSRLQLCPLQEQRRDTKIIFFSASFHPVIFPPSSAASA